MKTLLGYIGTLKEYLIFSLLIVISLILIFQNNNLQMRYIRAVAVSVLGSVQSMFSFIPDIFNLQEENEQLHKNNLDLSNELSQLREVKLENMRLRQMLEFKELTKLKTISAEVIGKTLIQTRNTITLNVGEKDSVKNGMPVITERGLVGLVVAASSNYCVAQILFNKDLKISAKDQRSRVDGIIAWEGESYLIMKNVPKSFDVKQGDVIITSEYSSILPPGIPIGFVVAETTVDNLFKKIDVEPFVNFETLEEVFIVKQLRDEERKNLEKLLLEKKR